MIYKISNSLMLNFGTNNDKSKYIGNVKDGQRHGFGTQTFTDGSTYEGHWLNN